jgi:glutamine synthetase
MEERLLTTPSDDDDGEQCWTPQGVKILLANDQKVKVAGIDFDGIPRGKVMSKEKFLSSLDNGGFGMSSAVFGWDMHDVLYAVKTSVTSSTKGYQDFTVEVDLASMRRLPFEDGLPFFLLRFISRGEPVCVDGRNIVAALSTDLELAGMRGLAGGSFPHHCSFAF